MDFSSNGSALLADVFDEVEEELRQERYQALLKQWGPWVAGVAAAVVIGVGANQYLTWSGAQRANAASDRYMDAAALYEEGNLNTADAQFAALAEDGPRGYAALALMRRADIALSQDRADDAARLYEQAAERAPDPLTRDIARYQAALARFDALSFDDLAVRLEPLAAGAAPIGPLARELMAAAAMRDERWDDARSRYEVLALGLDIPPGMQRRIVEAQAYINQNAPAAPAEVTPTDATPSEAAPTEATGTDTEEGGQ